MISLKYDKCITQRQAEICLRVSCIRQSMLYIQYENEMRNDSVCIYIPLAIL